MKNPSFTEEELDLFVREPLQFSEQQRKEIEQYLAQNTVADEYVRQQRLFYQEMDKRIQSEPSSIDKKFAEQVSTNNQKFLPSMALMKKEKREIFSKYSEIFEVHRTLPQLFIRYARIYPIRTTSFVATLAATLLLMVNVIKPTVDGNPSYAEIKDNVLTVYNSQGQILFAKSALGTPDYIQSEEFVGSPRRPFLVADVDGDGINEVLTNLYNEKIGETTNTLVCFSNKGVELWRYLPSFSLSHLDDMSRQATQSLITDFNVMPATAVSKPRIFIVVFDPSFMPACVSEIDPINKRELNAYWHPGGISKIFPYDINNDGTMELLIAGVNDVEDMAFCAAIDLNNFSGASSTAPPNFDTDKRVQEIFYCMLPPTQFYKSQSSIQYNFPWELRPLNFGKGMFVLETYEFPPGKYKNAVGGIKYVFNKDLQVSAVNTNSHFETAYQKYVTENNLDWEPLGQSYFEKLKNNVRYWDGEKFVKYPTFNKKYEKKLPLP